MIEGVRNLMSLGVALEDALRAAVGGPGAGGAAARSWGGSRPAPRRTSWCWMIEWT